MKSVKNIHWFKQSLPLEQEDYQNVIIRLETYWYHSCENDIPEITSVSKSNWLFSLDMSGNWQGQPTDQGQRTDNAIFLHENSITLWPVASLLKQKKKPTKTNKEAFASRATSSAVLQMERSPRCLEMSILCWGPLNLLFYLAEPVEQPYFF